MNRCVVCNSAAFYYPEQGNTVFCSQECETEYNGLMEEIDDNLNQEDEKE